MKKLLSNLTSLAVFIDILTLLFLYYCFYKGIYTAESPHFHQVMTVLVILSHILTAKSLYDLYNKKEKGE